MWRSNTLRKKKSINGALVEGGKAKNSSSKAKPKGKKKFLEKGEEEQEENNIIEEAEVGRFMQAPQ